MIYKKPDNAPDTVQCPHCGESTSFGNFCGHCARKLFADACPMCWKNDGKPHNCGADNCNGDYLN